LGCWAFLAQHLQRQRLLAAVAGSVAVVGSVEDAAADGVAVVAGDADGVAVVAGDADGVAVVVGDADGVVAVAGDAGGAIVAVAGDADGAIAGIFALVALAAAFASFPRLLSRNRMN
jgi:hypothetical protein